MEYWEIFRLIAHSAMSFTKTFVDCHFNLQRHQMTTMTINYASGIESPLLKLQQAVVYITSLANDYIGKERQYCNFAVPHDYLFHL